MVKLFPTTKHCSIVTRIHKPTFGYGEHRTLQTISCQTMTCTVASKLTINCQIITCTWLAIQRSKTPKNNSSRNSQKVIQRQKLCFMSYMSWNISTTEMPISFSQRVHGVVTIMFFSEHMSDLSTSVWEHQTLF